MTNSTAEINWIRHKDRTCSELINRRRECKDGDILDVIEEQLDSQFPSWSLIDRQDKHNSGREEIHVRFRQEGKIFPTAKLAYVWLVEKIISSNVHIKITNPVLQEMFVRGERGAVYLALSPDALFPGDPTRAGNQNCWNQLSNGWYLNLNLDNDTKWDKLFQLSAVFCLKSDETDWPSDGNQSDLSDLDEL